MKIYFASPLFNDMELQFNASVVEKLRASNENLDIYLPQENMAINDKSAYADSVMIANGDNQNLLEADVLVAVLDGASIDVGVATEIGIAFAQEMPILGLYTDTRQGFTSIPKKIEALETEIAENQFHYVNLFTVGCIKQRGMICTSVDSLIEELNNMSK